MDFSKFKSSDWLKAGGGLVMLIAYFLTWWSVKGAGDLGEASGSDYFLTGTVPWILLVAIGVLTVLAVAGVFKLPATVPWPLVFLGAAALSLLLILIRFFSDGFDEVAGFEFDTERGAGLYLALLAAIAVVIGCVLGFKESGGNLNDLKDVNKIKGQFGGGSSSGGTPSSPAGWRLLAPAAAPADGWHPSSAPAATSVS